MMVCFYSIENRKGERFFNRIRKKGLNSIKKDLVNPLLEAGFFVDTILLIKDGFEERVNELFEKFCKRRISQGELLEEARKYAF